VIIFCLQFLRQRSDLMDMLTPREEILRVLEGEDIGYFPRPIPQYTPIVDTMKVTGAFFPAGNNEAHPMAELALAAHELCRWNAVMLPWASTVESEALGCRVVSREGDIAGYPQVKERAFADAYEVELGSGILEKGTFPAVFDAIGLVRTRIDEQYAGSIPVIALSQGPFTVSGNVIGVNDMFKQVIRDPKRAAHVLDRVSDLNIRYINRMLECGADVVLLADPSAQGLTGEQFKRLLVPVYRKITQGIPAKVMLHVCGKTSRIAGHLPDTGFVGFSFDYPCTSVEDLRAAFGNRLRLIGSVPTLSHLLNGTREDVIGMTLEMIKKGVDLLAPSCGLPPYSPLENIRAMAEGIELYNRSL
jgi:[methyl-Co(III) methanol-specific corrinoid protein]:coenzyme M methyltransferase